MNNIEDLSFSIQNLQEIFKENSGKFPNEIVHLSDNYDKIYNVLSNSFSNYNNQVSLIYGFPGFGRKSAIDYALSKMKMEKKHLNKIYIDAKIFCEENSIVNIFLKQLQQQNSIKNKKNINDFEEFFAWFKEEKLNVCLVLIIDNIEELVTIKRQTVLYRILEWLRYDNSRVILFGITTNIMFSDLLEKRVKSRFSSQ